MPGWQDRSQRIDDPPLDVHAPDRRRLERDADVQTLLDHFAGQLEKAKVCPLRQSLQTQVRMFITEEGKQREMFCN